VGVGGGDGGFFTHAFGGPSLGPFEVKHVPDVHKLSSWLARLEL